MGLGLGLLGAVLLAYEMFVCFTGRKYEDISMKVVFGTQTPEEVNETKEYKAHQQRKRTCGIIGLVMLFMGLILQVISTLM